MLNPDVVLGVIHDYYGVTLAQLRSRSRKKSLARIRMICYWLLYEVCDMSHQEIADHLYRERTTVLGGCKRVRDDLVMTIPKALMSKLAEAGRCKRDPDHS